MLIVGLPIFLTHWLIAERQANNSTDELFAFPRRLFFGAVFVTTGLVAFYALRRLLNFIFNFPGDPQERTSTVSAVIDGVRVVVYAAAWAYFARVRTRRLPEAFRTSEKDRLFDLAVYTLTAFSLGFLLFGLRLSLRQITLIALDLLSSQALLLRGVADPWDVWGTAGSWVLVGGAVWVVLWRFDLVRDQRRALRVLYLYVVILFGAALTLGGGAYGLDELARRLLGYIPPDEKTWYFLVDALPAVLIGGVTWAYHWSIVRRQAAYNPEAQGVAEPRERGIAWPRRPFHVVLALSGVATTAPALISLIWLGLDLLFNTHADLSGFWWRDHLSYGVVGTVLGGAVWLTSWWLLQRAAIAAPGVERTATARRVLLSFVVLGGALGAIGFCVALLWLVFRTVLGDTLTASALSGGFKDLSAALVAAALAVYHGIILRSDMRLGDHRQTQITLRVLLAPGAERALEELRERLGKSAQIDVLGGFSGSAALEHLDRGSLWGQIAALGKDGVSSNAVLLLSQEGGVVVGYEKERLPI
jgi:hypothetical protein